jgi:nitroreductase
VALSAQGAVARKAWAARQACIALCLLLASVALVGIDACPMEGFVPVQYDSMLGLEEKSLTTIALCALGYRSESDPYAKLPKMRLAKEQVVLHV